MVESENNQLRDQIEDMERELDFKERKITELEAELKIMRNEREQFVEMGVRLEIQTKELGMMTRDLKDQNKGKKQSPRQGSATANKSARVGGGSSTASSQILSLKNFLQKKLTGTKQIPKPKTGSPLEVTAASGQHNLTVATLGGSPRNPDGTFRARAGTFNKGNVTMRSPENPSKDSLAREFAMLRASEDPIDQLNIIEDVVDSHYKTHNPHQNRLFGSMEDGVITGRSLAELSSQRQSTQQEGQQGITLNKATEENDKTLEAAFNELKVEIEEQKSVINDLIDQITTKTIEVVELKKQIDDAFKQAANAKLSLAQCH